MFVKAKVIDMDGKDTVISINMLNISHLTLENAKNADEGTRIHLRSGEWFKSSTPMDILSFELARQCEAIMTVMYIGYMAESHDLIMTAAKKQRVPKPKKTSSRTSSK